MNPYSVGLLLDGRPRFVPSTAEAIVELLKFHEIKLAGDERRRHRSQHRRRPPRRGAAAERGRHGDRCAQTHIRCPRDHTTRGRRRRRGRTRGLPDRGHDRAGATVIDAGINVTPAGIAGDVDADSVASVAGALSPVPGGVGAVTSALLLRNVLTAAETQTAGG